MFGLKYTDMAEGRKIADLSKLTVVTIFSTALDMIFHPLHLVQSRYILQDRRKDFYTYKNILGVWGSAIKTRSLFAGVQGHLFINTITYGCLIIPKSSDFTMLVLGTFLPSIITYPLITVMRRLECQSTDKGMLPFMYKNYRNALYKIFKDEGYRGFYRGFGINFAFLSLITAINMLSNSESP